VKKGNRCGDLTQYGWKIVNGRLECDWESVENREAVRKPVGLLVSRLLMFKM
jgi:hypothetical protein